MPGVSKYEREPHREKERIDLPSILEYKTICRNYNKLMKDLGYIHKDRRKYKSYIKDPYINEQEVRWD